MASWLDELNVRDTAQPGLNLGLDTRVRVENEPDSRAVGKLGN